MPYQECTISHEAIEMRCVRSAPGANITAPTSREKIVLHSDIMKTCCHTLHTRSVPHDDQMTTPYWLSVSGLYNTFAETRYAFRQSLPTTTEGRSRHSDNGHKWSGRDVFWVLRRVRTFTEANRVDETGSLTSVNTSLLQISLRINLLRYFSRNIRFCDRLCGLVVRVLGYRSAGQGSIPGTTRKNSSGSGTGYTQPREYNWGATW
jgi:hypothetical protein